MRQGPNAKRSRGRGNGGRKQNVPLRLQTLDSSGPNGKLRGNAYQLHEKYLALARDAHSAGDRIAAENFYQHAEHYYRIINANGGPGPMHRHDFEGGGGGGYDGPDAEQPDIRPGPGQGAPINGSSDGTEPQPY